MSMPPPTSIDSIPVFRLFSLFLQTHSMTHLMIIPVMEDTNYIEDLTLVIYDKVIAKLVMKSDKMLGKLTIFAFPQLV